MQDKKILILILNWNGWKDTQECLQSLLAIDYPAYAIAIVDNGSAGDCDSIEAFAAAHYKDYKVLAKEQVQTAETIPANLPDTAFTLIKNNENLGFAKANNIGIRYAFAMHYEWVLLLNNDTIVQPGFLSILAMEFGKAKYSAVTPQIRYYAPRDVIWNCGAAIRRYNEHYYYKDKNIKHVPDMAAIKEVAFATGCALLMNITETGFLTEKFFFGEEDFELALRLKKQGKKIACITHAIIYHKESTSINQATVKINKLFVHYLNRLVNTKDYARITWPLHIFYRSFRLWLSMCGNKKIGFFNAGKYGLRFCFMAFKLKEVNKQTFFDILSYPIEHA